METAQCNWQKNQESDLRQALKSAAEAVIQEQPTNEELRYILRSTAERQLEHGLSECHSRFAIAMKIS